MGSVLVCMASKHILWSLGNYDKNLVSVLVTGKRIHHEGGTCLWLLSNNGLTVTEGGHGRG